MKKTEAIKRDFTQDLNTMSPIISILNMLVTMNEISNFSEPHLPLGTRF